MDFTLRGCCEQLWSRFVIPRNRDEVVIGKQCNESSPVESVGFISQSSQQAHRSITNLHAVTPYSSAPWPRENWVKSPCKS